MAARSALDAIHLRDPLSAIVPLGLTLVARETHTRREIAVEQGKVRVTGGARKRYGAEATPCALAAADQRCGRSDCARGPSTRWCRRAPARRPRPAAHGSEDVQPTLLMGNVSCRLSGASVAAAAAHHLNATLERWWRTELRAESHHFCPYVLVESLTPRLLARPGRSGVSRPSGVWRQTRTLQTPLLES